MMHVPISENQAPEWCGAVEWEGVMKAIYRRSCGHVSDLTAALKADERFAGIPWVVVSMGAAGSFALIILP